MNKRSFAILGLMLSIAFCSYISAATQKIVKIWLFGDSTVKDYANNQDACSSVLKIAGWGEFIQGFLLIDSLEKVNKVIVADSVVIDNKANGGRAARTYIDGSDKAVLQAAYAAMQAGDYMFIQFGHNDEADCSNYPDRCTTIPDFKKYISMYVDSVLSKKATPILITPMVRNAWPEYNTHDNTDGSKANQQVGNFSLAMQQVAKEKGVPCIDLTQRSIDQFNSVGDDVTKYGYFRKVRTGVSLPAGCSSINDNTHFQPNGAKELARQVYLGLQNLCEIKVIVSDTGKGTVMGYSNGVKDKANKNFLQLTNDFKIGSGWYESTYNSTVKITAIPKKGYVFRGWGGDITGSQNPYTVTMNKSYSITADFADSQSTNTGVGRTGTTDGVFKIESDPLSSTVCISYTRDWPGTVGVTFYDLTGKKVKSVFLKKNGSNNHSVTLSGLCRVSGVYLCQLHSNGVLVERRVILQ